ncbi:MAG: bifunctional protein-disulfide isomerase/oxidoreductase DsbC [Methylomonas sp.]|nr:bifunctional protein-disulfide isomerase/oxidoreductase DsbC [Methylomonas sp.]PPD21332.1 MAG: bifunctional protein-disulfide isomerase/oxidoreductase DsbC [Methylomonas sp.]PPD26925.1 MAG: bifunctional protein-disulfide isomerase/oxidoreductase DsbC [Methylomonas sp.]PPD38856.1 MAG: bifunctional protein-disulfide isomerase/oxidoreductase DsbC [Methylomonas sp.]PPD41710.1 MAG: bifunctional protein-disulfide isomerase/oxidoreductase DsbC [Methylomonas sp.]
MKKLYSLLTVALLTLSSSSWADEAAIKKALSEFMPEAKVDSISPSEIKGLYEVVVGASIFYASEDGKYLIQGQLYDAFAKENLTENRLSGMRKQALDKVGEHNMITFKAPNAKYQVSVFTDIDCGYCRKLHAEIDQYMAKGISVRYLFFPRAGKGSESYAKAVSVWCADDRQKALTAAKKGESVATKQCSNPVDDHMNLGEAFGMSGTPMIVTQKGNVLPGYVPAEQLVKVLGSE